MPISSLCWSPGSDVPGFGQPLGQICGGQLPAGLGSRKQEQRSGRRRRDRTTCCQTLAGAALTLLGASTALPGVCEALKSQPTPPTNAGSSPAPRVLGSTVSPNCLLSLTVLACLALLITKWANSRVLESPLKTGAEASRRRVPRGAGGGLILGSHGTWRF